VTNVRLEAEWIDAPAPRAVMAALGGDAWFVGGCVRNALMDRPVTDIDLATPLTPGVVSSRLEAAGLRAVPTGIEHGTVTAVAKGQGLEITTFRGDVRTFGRHAEVRFTTDMAEDAARRDFTMNALYADAEGRVVDPLGGLADLRAGRVRFIGDAAARIREDYLRILRFFRFSAWYGRTPPEPEGLTACASLAHGLEGLARERIGAEMTKLLAAPDPAPAVAAMAAAGVLDRALPGARADRLAALIAVEAAAGAGPDWRRRLAALAADAPAGSLRLSRADAREVEEVVRLSARDDCPAVLAEMGGVETARSAVLVRAAAQGSIPPATLEAELQEGAAAEFPLIARDLIEAGMTRGPELGAALARARSAWRDSRFSLDRASLRAIALDNGQDG